MKFSIITVCYNSANTIQRTIDSVLSQTYQDYEYIIVDGRSKDNTLQIIKDAEPLFKGKLRWISEPDTGIYNAMNKGIAMATGDIVGIINSDDWYSPDALTNVAEAAIGKDLSKTIMTGYMFFHYKSGKPGLYGSSCKNDSAITKRLQNLEMCICHPSTFVPKIIYDTLGCFDENLKIAADADFMFRCAYNNINFIGIKKVLANMSEGGMTTSNNSAILNDRRIIFEKFIESSILRRKKMLQCYVKYFIKGLTPRCIINFIRKTNKRLN